MQHLSDCPGQLMRELRYLFTDIDDTLTTDGRLTAAAYGAMERLQLAGLRVIPVTGRPAGWCDHIARMWPVDGVVGENGAFYFRYDVAARKMIRVYARSDEQRRDDATRLDGIAAEVAIKIPKAAISADQPYRVADLAIDFCEDVPALGSVDVARIVDVFEDHCAVAKISSIHVNGWYGDYDKLTTTKRMMAEQFGMDLDDATTQAQCAFAGDSPNDAPMFGFFDLSVGVANVKDQIELCIAPPKWITTQRSGAGFVELADAILARGAR